MTFSCSIAILISIFTWRCFAVESDNRCSDKETCCYYPCDELNLSGDQQQFDQKGNCGFGCTDGLVPDLNGDVHTQLYFMRDYYYAEHNIYSYDDPNGAMKIEGDDKNMFDRCFNQCFPGETFRPTASPTSKGPTLAPTPQRPTPAPNSCIIKCGEARCAEDIPRFLFAGQSNMEGHTEEAKSFLFADLVNTVTTKGVTTKLKLQEMEVLLNLAQESTLGSSKAEARGVYKLRKYIKKESFTGMKKPYKRVVCSWTIPDDDNNTKLDCERYVSPTACGDNYGPELMFAHSFPTKKSPIKLQRVGVIKVARGGTQITEWMKNGGRDLKMWQVTADAIAAAKGSIEAFVWFQGESDSFDEENKNDYYDNLTTYIADIRNEIFQSSSKFQKASDVPVVIVELGPWIYYGVDPTVIEAQREYVKNTANTALVNTGNNDDENKRLSKFYHFDAAAMMIIGDRIAKAVAKLLRDA